MKPGPAPPRVFRHPRLFTCLAVALALAAIESVSGLVLGWRGELHDQLAFHPFLNSFRSTPVSTPHQWLMYDPFLLFRNRPGAVMKGGIRINAAGYIDNGTSFPDLAATPPADRRRVLVLGGSTVAGWGASGNAGTLPAALGRELGPGYEVINGGVAGYFSFQELMFYLADGQNLAPDVVVFYDGWNDFTHRCLIGGYLDEWQRDRAWPNDHQYALYLLAVLPQLEAGQLKPVNLPALRDSFYTTIVLRRLLTRFGLAPTAPLREVNDVTRRSRVTLAPGEAAARYLQVIETASRAVPRDGVRLVCALQPILIHKPVRSPAEETFAPPAGAAEYYRAAAAGFAALRERAHRPGVTVADLTVPAWTGVSETVYVDEAHLNDRGNELIARRLAPLVRGDTPATP